MTQRTALHYDQLDLLATQVTDPEFPAYGWDVLIYLSQDHPGQEAALDAALKIGYNLGLRAARGENLLDLPRHERPNPLADSFRTAD